MEDEFGWAGDRLESGAWLTTMAFDSSFFLWSYSDNDEQDLKPIGYPVDTRSLISPVC